MISFIFYSIHFEGLYIFIMHQHTATSNSTIWKIPVISSSNHQKTGLYQGSADSFEGDRNFDLISLLQKYQEIHYCNQSVLAVFPDLNIFVFSITIVYLVSRSALVRL